MSGGASRRAVIGAIIRKDLVAFTRDRFFVLITFLGLVFYVLIFWVLPNTVGESLRLGVHGAGLDVLLDQFEGEDEVGLVVESYPSGEALLAAVETGEGDLVAGIDFPDDFLETVQAGETTVVRVYLQADVPAELRGAVTSLVREIAYLAAGSAPPVTQPAEEEVVLGVDRAGDQVSIRERMRPMFAFFALMVETFALAALVATEIQSKTVTAVLATPARTSDFLAAKGIVGTGVAFAEAALLMLAIRAFDRSPLVMVTALLLGAVLVTGFGLMAGSTGRDFIGIIFWSILFIVPLTVPAIAALFPGTAAGWVKLLPSYGLVQTVVGITAYGAGFEETLPHLAALAAWCAAVFGMGWLVLKRKVETL